MLAGAFIHGLIAPWASCRGVLVPIPDEVLGVVLERVVPCRVRGRRQAISGIHV